MTTTSERLEVERTIEAAPDVIFRVHCDPQGHVAIDSTGILARTVARGYIGRRT